MAAYHTLDTTGTGFMRLQAREAGAEGPHCLELFELAGQRYLRLTLHARNPGGGAQVLTCPLSRAETEALAEAAGDLLARLRDG